VADLEAALTERTRAVVALHYGGYPCAIENLVDICRQRGVAVVEDAAHAVGARLNGKPCGSFGDVGCFSFFSNKNLPVGEGGMIVTKDDDLAAQMRLLRSHGMTTLTWDRHRGHSSTYDALRAGFNYRLDELRAALGSVQLTHLVERNAARAGHARRYRRALDGTDGVVVPFGDDDAASHHLAVVVLPPHAERDDVRARLAGAGVQTSVHYPPMHEFTAFADLGARRELKQTEAVRDRILTLPLYPHMRDEDVDLVVTELLEAVVNAAGVAS
jgi:dTDP-4-amino-4,6-dideoxygalactose transaminase